MNELKQHYLKELPDTPRLVETRDLLTWHGSLIVQNQIGDGFVVWSKDDDIGAIFGDVQIEAVMQAANDCSELLAFEENIEKVKTQLPEFNCEQATIFEAPSSFGQAVHSCRVISISEIAAMQHLPESLQEELLDLEDDNPLIVAAFAGDLAVAFAYVSSESDRLWDISIDTVESHRRKGYAESAVLHLMHLMQSKGKTAVWGALNSNIASLKLAHKLGFIEVDTLWVLTNPKST